MPTITPFVCSCCALLGALAPAQDGRAGGQSSDLESAEPAKVAWAAHRAGEAGDVALVPPLRKALWQWAQAPDGEGELVRLHLLDALVRLNAKVPGNELAPMARE